MGVPAKIYDTSKPQEKALEDETPSQSRFRWCQNLLLGVLSIFFSLIALEVGYRLFLAVAPQTQTWSDRPTSYYKPEASTSLQDYAYQVPKPQGTYRIAVIGDSFTFAPYMQFDDAFPKRLERMLNLNKDSQRVEVINYGVPGFSTSHEVATARQATKEGADLILLQITLNDPQLKPYRPTGLVGHHQFGAYEHDSSSLSHWKSLQFILERLHNSQTHKRYKSYYFDLFREGSKTRASFDQSLARFAKLKEKRAVPVVAIVFPLFGLPLDAHYPFGPIHAIIHETLTSLDIP
ncbi:MAG: SGNH/GDSL hydrolase family protein, partial [Bdellovibrionales bacterium]|nr:SGNH/GDSL hydrolase family protein [Bdellovibrionales bacterium]